jgi:DivIVA domain-containing protein
VTVFLLIVAVALIGGVAAVATGRVRGGLEDPPTSRPYRPLPEGPLTAPDVDAVRFSLGLRGYRMDEVDAVLARLRDELADRDAELAALRRRAEAPPAPEGEAGR